jgi:cellulose synthase (UDP-forming)
LSYNRAYDGHPDVALRKWLIALAILLIASLPLAYSALVVPLSPSQQAQVALAVLVVAIVFAGSRFMRPLIIFLSAFFSMRYFYWRVTSTLNLDNTLDSTVSVLLLVAESYGLVVLFLGYFQTIESVKRNPPPLTEFPSVDVFIPTYNEPVDVVRRTVIGALAIDYPHKCVYLLDDGKRPEMAHLAQELGCRYVARPDNRHAKAGNLNHALKVTRGEFIAIFDADHVPVRCFLRKTMGFFNDSAIALVQTAQHFFNPDPYERNLMLTDRIAPEQIFFYRVIQPGNDFWNSAFFCGSCAVLRRSALEAIGGFRTATVTEDAHTALQLHSRRLRSVYLPQALAAGLATETFAAHIRQRVRWARGMAQILRLDCPLFKRGLSLPQRLNYFNAMLHFFFGIPRLVLIVAPLTYLLFGAHPIKADAVAVLAYIFPHIGLSTIANSTISREFRHSFWSGVYEISIAPFVAGVTLLALVNPKSGKFNVTDKGKNVDHARFDLRSVRFTVALIVLCGIALVIALPIARY